MKKRPPYGLHLPCKYRRCRDADTVVVAISGAYEWNIRLKDCWAAESNTEEGKQATAAAKLICENAEELSVLIDLPEALAEATHAGKPMNVLSAIATFDRLVGTLYVSQTETLNELLVAGGYATREKTPRS